MSERPFDPAAFRDFEQAAWESVAEPYDEVFGAVTIAATEPLLDAAAVRRGTRLLDVASGPGHLAAAAAQRGADVTGIDFSSAMVRIALSRYPGLHLEVGDAESPALGDSEFDAVTISYGILHLAQPARARAEPGSLL